MFNNFLTNINNNSLFGKNDFLLLAVSGGVDSVVLLDLLCRAEYKVSVAHCNFGLRGKDSDEDEKLVMNLCEKYGVKCFSIRFNTLKYADDKKISVQMAARELRYKWFEELMNMYGLNYLLTAHHLDDQIETVLLNQLKGTGIKGLTGISSKQNFIVRPLLNFTKEEILNYAKTHQLPYREDVSNFSDTYQRNYLRLHIVPLLKNIQPQLYKVFQKNVEHFSEAAAFVNDFVDNMMQDVIQEDNQIIKIDRKRLNEKIPPKHLHFVLYQYLSGFHFNDEQIKNIELLIDKNHSGKKFFSQTHTLFFDRKYVCIASKNNAERHEEYLARNTDELNLYSKYKFKIIANSNVLNFNDRKKSYVNADFLVFPLKLRLWKSGDKFRLLGTDYDKKLSDVFIDKKVPLLLKNKIVLLCNSNDDIVWVSHLNLVNDKYKVKNDTKNVLMISVYE